MLGQNTAINYFCGMRWHLQHPAAPDFWAWLAATLSSSGATAKRCGHMVAVRITVVVVRIT